MRRAYFDNAGPVSDHHPMNESTQGQRHYPCPRVNLLETGDYDGKAEPLKPMLSGRRS